ncbi:glutaredoxin family protein [Shewanella phaeophyticola]|uniref:Glutathione S-transferase domain-containing protein n=1 Tax=Shewanella phaeophyticola TaxID=2978345 RepID=A0ABT2P324_9GAMM|nr:glutathione S-transferase domain-containing protein [Shewanella sp. KJ10-1]MCT8986872.1 glutathione S-transferase domain-containing protein [Shewanella sp. KJ10-1]MCU7375953.1 glutathione S-transferase domain-containing protein [Paucibacter sp. O1-1]MDA3830962.1 glutathione S-transferase domain-containing protein [Paucibacter sp. O1-1]
MFIVRWILGRIILLLNFVFAPKKRQRPPEQQDVINQQTQSLALYQYAACPFCVKVRREMRRQNLNINLVDAKQEQNKAILTAEGGKLQVPCLRIEQDGQTQWLYESKAITSYLNERFT